MLDSGENAAADLPRAGARLGERYEIVSKVASGGLGVVFAARDLAIRRLVAVKVLAPRKQQSEHARARLFREARAMARIAHPGIVQVFDQGDDPAFGPFLVMELLRGEDLSRLLQRAERLSPSAALELIEQACLALQAAHDHGIYHRDLKPSNLFLVEDPLRAAPLVKLIDFGVARFEADEDALTEPGDVLGTIAYMAPERWNAPDRGDACSDVYSLAAVAYELLGGARPFRATTHTALRLAIANDTPAPLATLCPTIDARVAAAVERALRKAPRERFSSARDFARALGFQHTPSVRSEPAGSTAFLGTERYRPRHVLARSRSSEVYVAEDRLRGADVLLKRVRKTEPEALFRIKNEFRVARELEHPNLVRLLELVDAGSDVWIVMDRVEGVPLLEYVGTDEVRIRRTLAQLTRALSALHARGLVHRDVKPDNVIVEESGRAVLLDLGLAAPHHAREEPRGTLAYVAPEALEGRFGPEADFFALGVVLHQALTRELPSRTATGELAALSSNLPGSSLGELCARLLERDPSRRPQAHELLRELAGGEPDADEAALSGERRIDALHGAEVFVGRGDALALLDAAFKEAASGSAVLLCVEGTSGIGKSTLLKRFQRRLVDSTPALALSSRARQYESVPYPALDEAIDQLSSHLRSLPDAHVEALLPRHGSRLSDLFPILARVGAIVRAAATPDAALTPADLRRHASDALRDLLRRLADRQPLALFIDDLQWMDPDSRALLTHLLSGTQAAPLLVVGAVRDDDEASAVLKELEDKLPHGVMRRVPLGPLSHAETHALIEAKVGGLVQLPAEKLAAVSHQTGGVPYFVELLVSDILESDSDVSAEIDIDHVLAAKQRRLTAELREVLELVAVSSRPLPSELLLELAGAPDLRAFEPLISGRFLRLVRSEPGWVLEPYHSRIRDAAWRALDEGQRRERHARLAEAFRKNEAATPPEVLVEHLAGSGETSPAGQLAYRAAELASEQLAFSRAAALFGVALAYGAFASERYVGIARRCAEALQNAGQRRKAGEVLLEAIQHASSAPDAELLRREAGTHFLLSGDIELGLELLSPALELAKLEYPSTEEAIPRTFEALAALESRGLTPCADRGLLDAAISSRLELSLLLAQGLAHIDLRALPFACHALHTALDAGDASRLRRALAVFVVNASGSLSSPLIEPALQLCRELTKSSPSPYGLALLYSAEGERAFFQSDFLAAESWFERAERTLLASCAGTTRELATVRDMAVWVQYAQKGDFRSQVDRTMSWLAEAESSRDLFHTGMLRVAHALVWIAHDDPQRARAELRKADAEWTGPAGVLQVGATLYHDVIDRYEQIDGPPIQGEAARNAVANTPAAQGPFLSGYFVLNEVWRAVRRIAHDRAEPNEAGAVRESVDRLRKLGLGIWLAVADALESNLDYLEGKREQAILRLENAEQAFRRLHMLCLAACARMRRGQLTRDDLGQRLEAEAEHELRTLGVADPARWCRAYWSMFEAGGVQQPTQLTREHASVGARA
ncbi:MAG: protein kinase [Myxococcota bacterium]|nr:protein kinase [Myxococcota bacterium]